VQGWVIRPERHAILIGNYAFVGLIAAVLVLTLLHGIWRTVFLVPTLYLAAFVWENRLDFEPSTTRLIVLGALLIVLMNARPQGLLGTARVEIG
jgi:ABC-type branched-subunit amino acid transport system permease subunit